MMLSAYYCTPPFHTDPDLPSQASDAYYLVTSPQAKAPGPGVYPSWSSAQRVAEKVPRGGAVRFSSYNACVPGWHACCDTGEHDHLPNPESGSLAVSPSPAPRTTQARPVPSTPTKSPSIGRTPTTPSTVGSPSPSYAAPCPAPVAGSTPVLTDPPADPVEVRLAAVHAMHYAVCGATLFSTIDARHAAHVAAGHSIPVAKQLADGERAAAQVEALGPTPHLVQTFSMRSALAQQLHASLRQLNQLQQEEIMLDNELWGTFEDHGYQKFADAAGSPSKLQVDLEGGDAPEPVAIVTSDRFAQWNAPADGVPHNKDAPRGTPSGDEDEEEDENTPHGTGTPSGKEDDEDRDQAPPIEILRPLPSPPLEEDDPELDVESTLDQLVGRPRSRSPSTDSFAPCAQSATVFGPANRMLGGPLDEAFCTTCGQLGQCTHIAVQPINPTPPVVNAAPPVVDPTLASPIVNPAPPTVNPTPPIVNPVLPVNPAPAVDNPAPAVVNPNDKVPFEDELPPSDLHKAVNPDAFKLDFSNILSFDDEEEEDEGKEEEDEESADEGWGDENNGSAPVVLGHQGTHAERHPHVLKQPEREPKEKAKKATAEQKTAVLKEGQLKACRKGMKEAVETLHKYVKTHTENIAKTFGLSKAEVRGVIMSATKLKKPQAYHEFNTKVWWTCRERNVGQAHQARLDKLKHDWMLEQASKTAGTRKTNSDAAKDVTLTGDRIFEELLRLKKHTGTRGFCVLTGSHSSDTIWPSVIGSVDSVRFLPDVLHMDSGTFATKYRNWSCFDADAQAAKEETHPGKKAYVSATLRDKLREATGKPKVDVQYQRYKEVMHGKLGYEIVGWPDNVPICAPSNMGVGGSAAIDTLYERLKNGEYYWRAVDPAVHAEINKAFMEAAKKKKPRKKKGAAKADDSDDAEETEKEEAAPPPKKRKRVAREKPAASEDEEEERAPKKKALKRKHVEEEEEEEAPPPKKKVAKKKKVVGSAL
ncbi:hypothetical protein B0H17DRAFT_1216047 [Mycena rosella]|uniref:Uncharacterized protein n=1 Tax=Mycena rosella TaxID=1033263 RepID=A0AAD7CCY2_MYCRO|nr:hypothetical protein B0H17DRAFT_1216047 [Mycena rosella]